MPNTNNTGYDRCTSREKAVLDYMMDPVVSLQKPAILQLSIQFNLTFDTTRNVLTALFRAYDIDPKLYSPQTRLVYLRAKELGLL